MKQLLCLFLFCSSAALSQDPQTGWIFAPDQDLYTDDAMLDLRSLNEGMAGENGFIRLSADGESFETSDGQAIRFWAVGGGDGTRNMNQDEIGRFAKFLAKKGVNMIRFHGQIHSVTEDIMQVNQEEVDAIWKLVAAMKKEGIYTTISPFWPHFIDDIPASWELGDYSVTSDKPWGLLYFNDRFQEAYKSWLTYLYTETNPYTGIALKDEPAVGLIQMLNEDGVFFWTIQGVKPSLQTEMESQYYDWLIQKYGSINDAYTAWNNLTIESDDPGNGRMGLYIIYEATIDQSGGKDLRLRDQINFYTHVQRSFYEEIYTHLKDIGCQQLINTTNWKTANSARLLDAERYTYMVADVPAVNRYFSPGHQGPNSGWRIEAGDKYEGRSVLYEPHKLPVNVKQVKGAPFIMTESSWPFPHKYLAESVFLTAAYASLSGFDTYYWFSPRASADGYSDRLGTFFTFADFDLNFEPIFKFNIASPGHMSPFPANALLYRMGYVKEGDELVHEVRSLQELYNRDIPLITEESGFDPNRDSYDNQTDPASTEIAPVAYLAGKVRVTYDGDPSATQVSGRLNELLDFENKVITSSTGELSWNYEKGQCTLDAPQAQGVTGFFVENETIPLSDITLTVNNDYAAIMAVSMDGSPLSTSEEVLIQVNTLYETTNYQENSATFELNDETVEGYEVVQTGQMPWRAANTRVNVLIRNTTLRSAHLLDENGYKVREIAVNPESEGLKITLPSNAMYVIANSSPSTITSLENDEPDQSFHLYPNPNNGSFEVEALENAFDSLLIIDVMGRTVYQSRKIRSNRLQVNSKLDPGIYFLHLIAGNDVLITRKLVIR